MEGQVFFGHFRFASRFRIRTVPNRRNSGNPSVMFQASRSNRLVINEDQLQTISLNKNCIIEYPILITSTGTICDFGFITRHQFQPAKQN